MVGCVLLTSTLSCAVMVWSQSASRHHIRLLMSTAHIQAWLIHYSIMMLVKFLTLIGPHLISSMGTLKSEQNLMIWKQYFVLVDSDDSRWVMRFPVKGDATLAESQGISPYNHHINLPWFSSTLIINYHIEQSILYLQALLLLSVMIHSHRSFYLCLIYAGHVTWYSLKLFWIMMKLISKWAEVTS